MGRLLILCVLITGRAAAAEPASGTSQHGSGTEHTDLPAEPLVLPQEATPGDPPRNPSLAAHIPEPSVPLTVDEPAHRKSVVPYYLLVGALVTAFAAGTLWALAANEDNRYKNAPAGPNRQGMLDTANGELLAAQVCGLVALAAVGTATVWLVF